jgi:tripartite-type tricarboxylate transporter receptor subunit TctC
MAWGLMAVTPTYAAYPEHPIKMIVSFPPGSGTDTNARYAAQKLQERIGVPVIVENRPGANSFIAAEAVVNAKPDGYTLLLASNSPVTTNVVMFKKLPYDPVTQLAPIAKLAYGPMALAVKADSSFKSVEDLIEYAKQKPDALNYGAGSASYRIATELFLTEAGIKAEYIPYKGAAPALTDLGGGHVDFVFADLGAVVPFLQSGAMRILAVTGSADLAGTRPQRLLHDQFYGCVCTGWNAKGHSRDAGPALCFDLS